jgi:hypothetical protein
VEESEKCELKVKNNGDGSVEVLIGAIPCPAAYLQVII